MRRCSARSIKLWTYGSSLSTTEYNAGSSLSVLHDICYQNTSLSKNHKKSSQRDKQESEAQSVSSSICIYEGSCNLTLHNGPGRPNFARRKSTHSLISPWIPGACIKFAFNGVTLCRVSHAVRIVQVLCGHTSSFLLSRPIRRFQVRFPPRFYTRPRNLATTGSAYARCVTCSREPDVSSSQSLPPLASHPELVTLAHANQATLSSQAAQPGNSYQNSIGCRASQYTKPCSGLLLAPKAR